MIILEKIIIYVDCKWYGIVLKLMFYWLFVLGNNLNVVFCGCVKDKW